MAECISPPDSSTSSHSPSNIALRVAQKQTANNSQRIRRRNRIITSCLECRKRKIKCDKLHPCTNCVKFTRDCLFLAPALDSASQGKLTELKERMGSLEKVLEQDVARQHKSRSLTPSSPGSSKDVLPETDIYYPDVDDGIENTPLTTDEAIYEDDADDEMMDLGIQLGKMRMTERIGGFVRPKFAVELGYAIRRISNDSINMKSLADVTAQYHAQNLDSFLGPSPDYIVPHTGLFFSSGASEGNSLMMFLPSKQVADKVMTQYWTAVHPICTTVYRPAFERQYQRFWSEVSIGFEPSNSLQAVVFAALFSAVISMPEAMVTRDFRVNKFSLADNFRIGCESALSRANLLRTTKVETLQAFVMYMIPLCRAEVSRAHSALTACAVRLAECIGLHRDGSHYGLSPVEIHVRRLIWHQLCFLDMRCCWASSPRPQIRDEEFDTKLPLNVNEDELENIMPPKQDADRWTDLTFSLIRFETLAMERFVWQERLKVAKKTASLTSLLATIQKFRGRLEQKYVPLIDETKEFHKLAMHYLRMSTLRYYIMSLHRYQLDPAVPLSARLENIVISAAINVLERAIALDTDPDLKPWAWYSGAYHQFQSALFLINQFDSPTAQREADRVWTCLDYVFDIPPGLSRSEKAMLVLGELRDRLAVYVSQRKQKAPISMDFLKPVPAPYIPIPRPSEFHGASPPMTENESSRDNFAAATASPSSSSNIRAAPPAGYGNQGIQGPTMPIVSEGKVANNFPTYPSAMQPPFSQRLMSAPDVVGQMSSEARRDMVLRGVGISGPVIQPFNFNDMPLYDTTMGKSQSGSPVMDLGSGSAGDAMVSDLSPPMGFDSGDIGMDIDWNELDKLFPGSSAQMFDFSI